MSDLEMRRRFRRRHLRSRIRDMLMLTLAAVCILLLIGAFATLAVGISVIKFAR